jgi:hypothetical protein
MSKSNLEFELELKKIKDEPDENLKNCLIKMIEKSMESQNILEIKKLLLNSIGYYKDGKIKKISNDRYEIRGNHGKYLVSKQNNDYICECPMYKKNGKYSNAGKQKCSHVQTVELFECVGEEKIKMRIIMRMKKQMLKVVIIIIYFYYLENLERENHIVSIKY